MKTEIKRAIDALGYQQFTPIQEKVIPVLLENKDCIIQSKTGSGKTAAYVIPILEQIRIDEKKPQVLVLVPTRELACQVRDVFNEIGAYLSIHTLAVYGKHNLHYESMDLKQRCHIVIGTPGRVLHHIQNGDLDSSKLKYFVMDEADEMIKEGFLETMQEIYSALPSVTACMVSATYDRRVEPFTKKPELIRVDVQQDTILECGVIVQDDKLDVLLQILTVEKPDSTIVFCRMHEDVMRLNQSLQEKRILSIGIHGGMDQEVRFAQVEAFKRGDARILVSTDLMARGIDIEKVDLIIHYDLPDSVQIYQHRIGRSGRMCTIGKSVCLFGSEEQIFDDRIKMIEIDSPVDISFLNVPIQKETVNHLPSIDACTLFISIGKSKKIRAGDLVGAICAIDGVDVSDIGIIKVQSHHSYVDILHGKEELVLHSLKRVKKKNVKVEITTKK